MGAGELLVIFLVTLLLFGAKRVPEIARSLGQGIREFRSAMREITRELQTPEPTPNRVSESRYARDERLRADDALAFERLEPEQRGI